MERLLQRRFVGTYSIITLDISAPMQRLINGMLWHPYVSNPQMILTPTYHRYYAIELIPRKVLNPPCK